MWPNANIQYLIDEVKTDCGYIVDEAIHKLKIQYNTKIENLEKRVSYLENKLDKIQHDGK
jgi:uncharacterized protein Yka (UPF0111/DUF47 family)